MLRQNRQETLVPPRRAGLTRSSTPSRARRYVPAQRSLGHACGHRRAEYCRRQYDCERITGLGGRASQQQRLHFLAICVTETRSLVGLGAGFERAQHCSGSALSQPSSALPPAPVIPMRPVPIAPCIGLTGRASGVHEVTQRPEFEAVVGEHDCLGGTERNAGPAVELPRRCSRRQDASPSLTCGLPDWRAISFLNASGS
jgi:hypothetical protein